MNSSARCQITIGRSKLGPVRPCGVLHTPAARTGSKCASNPVPSLGLATGTAARRSMHILAYNTRKSGHSGRPSKPGGRGNRLTDEAPLMAQILMGITAVGLYAASFYPLACLAFMLYKQTTMSVVAWAALGTKLTRARDLAAAAKLLEASLGGALFMRPAYHILLPLAGSAKAASLERLMALLLASYMLGLTGAGFCSSFASVEVHLPGPFAAIGAWLGRQLARVLLCLFSWRPSPSLVKAWHTLLQLAISLIWIFPGLLSHIMAEAWLQHLLASLRRILQEAGLIEAPLAHEPSFLQHTASFVLAALEGVLSAVSSVLRFAMEQPAEVLWAYIGLALGGLLALRLLPGSGQTKDEWQRVKDSSHGDREGYVPPSTCFPSTSTYTGFWEEAEGPASTTAGAKASESSSEPEWWVHPIFLKYVPAAYKEQLQREARSILQELQDGKLLHGRDYALSSLVALAKACKDAGGFQVHPRTDSDRTAMLRQGVGGALKAVMAQGVARELPQGVSPASFICTLAHALGVPDRQTVVIVHSEVAAACQSILVNAEAAHRTGDKAGMSKAVRQLAAVLAVFPLPLGSAEAGMVGDRRRSRSGLDFRRDFFFAFGEAAGAQQAGVVAELLGFNPQLVLAQLLLKLQAE